MNLQLPYNSRRDEVGGIINDDDWSDFIFRVEKLIKRVRRKRLRIIKRRKRNGKRLMPRKTLFKPMKRPNLAKNALWKEIFLDESSDDDSTVEDTDIFDDKGIENEGKFRLPPLYQPLVKETKRKTKEKQATFKTKLKNQEVKPPKSPLRSAAKNAKIISESSGHAKDNFNLKFVKVGSHILKHPSK